MELELLLREEEPKERLEALELLLREGVLMERLGALELLEDEEEEKSEDNSLLL